MTQYKNSNIVLIINPDSKAYDLSFLSFLGTQILIIGANLCPITGRNDCWLSAANGTTDVTGKKRSD